MKAPTSDARHSDRSSELFDTVMFGAKGVSMGSYVPEALHLLASMSGSFSGSWSPRERSPDEASKYPSPSSQRRRQHARLHQSFSNELLDGKPSKKTATNRVISSWLCLPDLNDVSETVIPGCACQSDDAGSGPSSIPFPNCDATAAFRTPLPTTPLSISTSPIDISEDEKSGDALPSSSQSKPISPPPPPRSATAIATKSRGRKRIDFDEAFSEGKLFPYMVDYCVSGVNHREGPDDDASITIRWNGHLPLDPVPQIDSPPRHRFLDRRRRYEEISRTGIGLSVQTSLLVCSPTCCLSGFRRLCARPSVVAVRICFYYSIALMATVSHLLLLVSENF